MASCPLVNGNGRLQTFDEVHVRTFELVEKLSRVGGKALDILPLPLGIKGVEGQGAFARPAGSRNYHQPVAGDVEVQILEVMGSDPANANPIFSRQSSVHRHILLRQAPHKERKHKLSPLRRSNVNKV